MKSFFGAFIIACASLTGVANGAALSTINTDTSRIKPQNDSVKLLTDVNTAYYQKIVKLDSNISEPTIYVRTLQFMASKNIQQTYGYQEEGKAIFSTVQDLNINKVLPGDDNETVQPYTVQFAIIIDMKNGRYRYTISNVVFFLPTETGNRRVTLFEVYTKTQSDTRRVVREAKNLIASFERYLNSLTAELYDDIERRSAMHRSKF